MSDDHTADDARGRSGARRAITPVAIGTALALAITTAGPLVGGAAADARTDVPPMPAVAPPGHGTEAELAAIAAQLEASIQSYEAEYGPRDTWADADAERVLRSSSLASYVGGAVFDSLIGFGVDAGMDSLLGIFGIGRDSTAEDLAEMKDALADLGASMDELHHKVDQLAAQIDALAEQLENVHEAVKWSEFRSSNLLLKVDVLSKIQAITDVMHNWDEDTPPSQSRVEQYVRDVSAAIRAVDIGVASPDGTLTMLLESADFVSGTSDLERYWTFVEAYRDEYRATVAQALIALQYVAQFDRTTYAEEELAVARARADSAVGRMWGAGVPLAQHDSLAYVHAAGSRTVMAGIDRPELPGEEWTTSMDRAVVEPILVALADGYRPGPGDHPFLGMYLWDRGMPGSYIYADTGVPVGGDVHYQYGMITADGYRRVGAVVDVATWNRWVAEGPKVKFMAVDLNAGGRAASFDADAVDGRAFGAGISVERTEGGGAIDVAVEAPGSMLRVVDTATGAVVASAPRTEGLSLAVEAGRILTVVVGDGPADGSMIRTTSQRVLLVGDGETALHVAAA